VNCPVAKSGTCLKSVSASVSDHPACTDGCELDEDSYWADRFCGGDPR
jgi:hypothetical protein